MFVLYMDRQYMYSMLKVACRWPGRDSHPQRDYDDDDDDADDTEHDVTVEWVVAVFKWAWRFRPLDVIHVALHDLRNRLRDVRVFSIP